MAPQTPEGCDVQLIDALTRGDVDAAVALYEPEASFVNEGQVVTGHAAIRAVMEAFVATRPQFTWEPKPTVRTGDLALTGLNWSLKGTDPDGKPIEMGGSSFEVVRRQPDGSWRFAIDNPDAG